MAKVLGEKTKSCSFLIVSDFLRVVFDHRIFVFPMMKKLVMSSQVLLPELHPFPTEQPGSLSALWVASQRSARGISFVVDLRNTFLLIQVHQNSKKVYEGCQGLLCRGDNDVCLTMSWIPVLLQMKIRGSCLLSLLIPYNFFLFFLHLIMRYF